MAPIRMFLEEMRFPEPPELERQEEFRTRNDPQEIDRHRHATWHLDV
jgi:hypothetical protein